MADPESQDDKADPRAWSTLAFGAGLGLVVGIVVFAVSQNPVWIGIGLVFGGAIGAVVQVNQR